MPRDWSESREFRRYARRIVDDVVPKIQDSAVTVSLVPRGEADIKFAVELGLSIMLDKPIIAVIPPGTQVPEHLLRVADRIVDGDIMAEPERLAEAVAATIAELREEDGRS